MNREYFSEACHTVQTERDSQVSGGGGIGTLGEKTLHAVLKRYFEPDTNFHEQKVGSYYADICRDNRIIEIQTKQFYKLRGKLSAFLPHYTVTVVYPIASTKYLIWVDPETGEMTVPRRSPKQGSFCGIFPELYRIREFLSHPNLRICVVLVDIEEYRLRNGWSADGKKGSCCQERIPTGIQEELVVSSPEEYSLFLPPCLPQIFSSRDFAKAAHVSRGCAQTALNLLFGFSVVERVGKQGNAYLYQSRPIPESVGTPEPFQKEDVL